MNVVTTVYAREMLVKAYTGDVTLPKITHIAFGVGGSGSVPDPNTTALVSEVVRKPVGIHTYPIPTTVRFPVTITGAEVGGAGINEAALLNESGKAVAIQNFGVKTIEPGETVDFDWDMEI